MTTKFEHTPGPWTINRNRLSPRIEGAGGEFIASVVSTLGMNEFSPANARLIAAAPEMLEALQFIVANPGPKGHRAAAELLQKIRGEA